MSRQKKPANPVGITHVPKAFPAAPSMEALSFETGRTVGRAEGRQEALSVDDKTFLDGLMSVGHLCAHIARHASQRLATTGRLMEATVDLTYELNRLSVDFADLQKPGPMKPLAKYVMAIVNDMRRQGIAITCEDLMTPDGLLKYLPDREVKP